MGAASPVNDKSPDNNVPSVGLSWTGEVAGHGVVTLHGDADSVEKQIFALNPSLAEKFVPTNRFMSKTPREFNDSEVSATPGSAYFYTSPRGDANGMTARDDVNGAKKLSDGFNPIDWYCGTFATGDGKSNLATTLRSFSPPSNKASPVSVDKADPQNLRQFPRYTASSAGSVLPQTRTPPLPSGQSQAGRTGSPTASVLHAP